MDAAPEDRTRTISMLKHWDLWPLDRRHRDTNCCCAKCFGDELPDELQVARKRKKAQTRFAWEEDYAA